jgi:hypothetical protein
VRSIKAALELAAQMLLEAPDRVAVERRALGV